MASWLHRVVLVGLLAAAYFFAWTPLRTAWTEHSAALLSRATPAETTVTARPAAHTIRVSTGDDEATTYTAPAGVKFLLPGLALFLIAPARPHLGLLFGGHLALGALAVGLETAGLAGLPGGLGMADFVQSYGVDAFSLGVPVLVLAQRTRTFRE